MTVSTEVINGMSKCIHTLSPYMAERRSSRSRATSLLFNTIRCEPIISKCKISVSVTPPMSSRCTVLKNRSSLTILLNNLRKSLPDRILRVIQYVTYNRVPFRAGGVRETFRIPSPPPPCHNESDRRRDHNQSRTNVVLLRHGRGRERQTGGPEVPGLRVRAVSGSITGDGGVSTLRSQARGLNQYPRSRVIEGETVSSTEKCSIACGE